jgi:hypothetical protein
MKHAEPWFLALPRIRPKDERNMFETSADFHWTTLSYNPGDRTFITIAVVTSNSIQYRSKSHYSTKISNYMFTSQLVYVDTQPYIFHNLLSLQKHNLTINIIFKHPIAFIYISYTLRYTVFNATLSFSCLFILLHVSAALGHHLVFCCQSCLTVIVYKMLMFFQMCVLVTFAWCIRPILFFSSTSTRREEQRGRGKPYT